MIAGWRVCRSFIGGFDVIISSIITPSSGTSDSLEPVFTNSFEPEPEGMALPRGMSA